jgi:hypothetical protein
MGLLGIRNSFHAKARRIYNGDTLSVGFTLSPTLSRKREREQSGII